MSRLVQQALLVIVALLLLPENRTTSNPSH